MPFGSSRRRHEIEKRQVMGRLAAVETLGIVHRNVEQSTADDQQRAIARIKKVMKVDLPDETAKDYVDVLLQHLRNSEVNINFKANEFFASKPTDKYATKFEEFRSTGAPFGGTRNETEEKMFHYSTANAGLGADAGTSAAVDRMNRLGPTTSQEFAGIIRPRYCTLNFAAIEDGFGAQWGRSHFKLKDHLKPNMSFVHTDSFDINSGRSTPESVQAQVATYHNMTRLICNMNPTMLDMLIDAASGQLPPGQMYDTLSKKYNFGKTSYIEAQLHAEILFSRDVDQIRICKTEILGDAKASKNLDNFVAKHQLNLVKFG